MLFEPSQQGSRRTFSPALQTAQEKFERTSMPAHPSLKKYRFEHAASFLCPDPWFTHMPRSSSIPIGDQRLNHTSPYTTPPKMQHGRDHPASFAASSPGNRHFSHISTHINHSTGSQGSQNEAADPSTSKQRSDQILFISNAPTLPLGCVESTRAARTGHTLTRLEPRHHPLVRTVTDWYMFARKQAAPPAFSRLKNPRYRTASLIGVGLVALMFVALFAQSGLTHQRGSSPKTNSAASTPQLASATMSSTSGGGGSEQPTPTQQQAPAPQPAPTRQPTPTQQPTPIRQQPPAPQPTPDINASKALVRISQLDPNQYASAYDYNIWAYSACSTAAMTEVFNAYGHHYRIADVLQVEARIGEITPDQGLLENVGVSRTATQIGFKTSWGNDWTLSRVLRNANAGHPVIVGWPPDRYPDGHIVVVTGGDSSHVYVADSSIWNRHRLSRSQFLRWWGGFAAVVTPK